MFDKIHPHLLSLIKPLPAHLKQEIEFSKSDTNSGSKKTAEHDIALPSVYPRLARHWFTLRPIKTKKDGVPGTGEHCLPGLSEVDSSSR